MRLMGAAVQHEGPYEIGPSYIVVRGEGGVMRAGQGTAWAVGEG